MRITLNEFAQERLLSIMLARGVNSPTHMLNIILNEAHTAEPTTTSFPVHEEAHAEDSRTEH